VVEQVIRPTGLVDPVIEVRPAASQVDNLLGEIHKVVEKGFRILVTTLTKRLSEDLSKYYLQKGLRVKYLHSDIETLERIEILRDLRLGTFDVLIGINLLREGLDLPEVALVAILDADKEGFLRSYHSLIQTIGRAARNAEGRVILYADKITDSMKNAMAETERRRKVQTTFNLENGITPMTILKPIHAPIVTPTNEEGDERIASYGGKSARKSLLAKQVLRTGGSSWKKTGEAPGAPIAAQLDLIDEAELPELAKELAGDFFTNLKSLDKSIRDMENEMRSEAKKMKFESAATLRDRIRSLKAISLKFKTGAVD